MIYLNQFSRPDLPYLTWDDTPEFEYGRRSTVASSACGLCSAVMVADRLLANPRFDIYDAIQLSYDTHANHASGTDYSIFAPAFAEKMGLKWEPTDDPERLLYCLRTGGAAVAHAKRDPDSEYQTVFTKGGHFFVVLNEEPDGRLCILDPSLTPSKFDTPDGKERVQVKGAFCYTTMDVLMKETAPKKPCCFHLFWRA